MGSKALVRAALYVRVSSEEQVEGYSLSAQERAIRSYCDFHGYQIVAEYRDEGKSARTDDLAKRPAFAQMLAGAEAGHFDVLIVHKLDRFARNLRVTLETLDRLEQASVGFVSVNENMDFATPMGRVVLSTMGSLAQFYSDNLSAETKKGKQERKRQGLYNGLLPFGVTKGPNGIPILDRDVRYCDVASRTAIVPANGLLLAFALAAAGKTDREVAQALTVAGYRTSGNRGLNPFTKDTVRPLLQNRFYLGELPDGAGGWTPGKHGALIDPELFDRAQQARARNTRRPRRGAGPSRPWALSGVAVCSCGASVVANSRPGGRRSLRCYGRIQGNGCDEPSFYEDVLEMQLAAIIGRFAVPDHEQERLARAWLRRQANRPSSALERERIDRKLVRLRDLFLEGDLAKAEYQARKATLTVELAALPRDEAAGSEAVGRRLAGYLANMASAWQAATAEERNRLARELFAEAIIENRTVVAVQPRPDLLPFFESVKWCEGGSDGLRSRHPHKATARPALLQPIPIAASTQRRRVGHSGRQPSSHSQPRRLSDEQRTEILALAKTRSIRSLAADFGVSHQTIWTLIRASADVA